MQLFRLFDLPPELVALAFEAIVLSRTWKRFMRLRFVSRRFKFFVDNTIFRLGLLKGFAERSSICGPTERRLTHPFLIEYMAYQVWATRKPNSLYGRIRRVAVAFCERSGNTGDNALMETLKTLCGLPRYGRSDPRDPLSWSRYSLFMRGSSSPWTEDPSPIELEKDLCVAAIYLGCRDHIKDLIVRGWQFCSLGTIKDVVSRLFGPAFEVAAVRGDVSMLRLLLSSNPNYNPNEYLPWHLQSVILRNAATVGHKHAFKFALDCPALAVSENLASEEPDEVVWDPEYRKYTHVFLEPPPLSELLHRVPSSTHTYKDNLFLIKARKAQAEVVRRLLSIGRPPHEAARWKPSEEEYSLNGPLIGTVEERDPKTVRLLLQQGEKPYNRLFRYSCTPLMTAVQFLNLPIAKMLLEAGADPNDGCPPPIAIAIVKEDTAMFRLLRESGARLDTPETGGWAMAIAQFYGFESMIEMLVQEGVKRDAILRRCREKWETLQPSWCSIPNRESI
ncbi:ankyrin repeat-containing domain protein, partial [Xylaria sp. FL1777]